MPIKLNSQEKTADTQYNLSKFADKPIFAVKQIKWRTKIKMGTKTAENTTTENP